MKITANGAWANVAEGDHIVDAGLSEALCVLFRGATVNDFGCGSGGYTTALLDSGIAAVGYDANPETNELTGGVGYYCDLSSSVKLPIADWVLSLEVGEHIGPECSEAFVENIARHCSAGAVVSWAYPGQTGPGHVNELWPHEVADKMAQYGLVFCEKSTKTLRKSVVSCFYLAKTVSVYRKADRNA